jgi:hypothetical protein
MNKNEVETSPDEAYWTAKAAIEADRARLLSKFRDLSSGGNLNQPLFIIERIVNNED